MPLWQSIAHERHRMVRWEKKVEFESFRWHCTAKGAFWSDTKCNILVGCNQSIISMEEFGSPSHLLVFLSPSVSFPHNASQSMKHKLYSYFRFGVGNHHTQWLDSNLKYVFPYTSFCYFLMKSSVFSKRLYFLLLKLQAEWFTVCALDPRSKVWTSKFWYTETHTHILSLTHTKHTAFF